MAVTSTRGQRGSMTLEYAVLTAVAIAALIGMSVVMLRALNGRFRQVGDQFGHGRQYQPGVTVVSGS